MEEFSCSSQKLKSVNPFFDTLSHATKYKIYTMPLFECLMNSNSQSLRLRFQIELCWCWCILEMQRMTKLLSASICPSDCGVHITGLKLQLGLIAVKLCREDVWVPGSLTDIHCTQIQIGPIKHSGHKTALIKDSQQSFNVNFLLFLTDFGTLKCPWRPWNPKYIGVNFNIVALAWTLLRVIHWDLTQRPENIPIFKASK